MEFRPTIGCLALMILVAGCANKEADAPVAAASAQAAKSAEGSSAPLPSTIPESFHMWEECAGKDFVVEADKLSLGIHDCRLLNVLAASTDTVKVKARCTELGDDVGEKLITLVRTGKGVDFDTDDGSIQCTGYEYKPATPTPATTPRTASEVAAAAVAAERPPATCDVKDVYGRSVSFRDTVDLKLLDPAIEDPCDIARDLVAVLAARADKDLAELCAKDAGYCEGDWRAKNHEMLTLAPEVYSVGTATYREESCPAYLSVVAIDDNWNVMFRYLGACQGKEAELLDIQKNVTDKYGRMSLFGDILSRHGYVGAMPESFTFRGEKFPFRTVKREAPATREPTQDDKIAQAYAKELTAQWSHADYCFDLMQQLYRYTGTGEPAAAQMRRMDQIFDGAVRAGCIRGL
jgi:hypothetical protein